MNYMNRISRTDACFNAFIESGDMKVCREPAKKAEPKPAPKPEIKELYYHYNGVVEDGATEWNIIIGQKADGSFVALSYSNFPF